MTMGIIVATLALIPFLVEYVLISVVLVVSDLLETVGTWF
ncbi:hypothetical protein HOT48_gp224 [Klebsiella phage ZCKP1]|jgi:hypothetical protein|nr:hypothetical protein HOT48_gp224 [Klebsiella phage ZCKP1]AWY08239.1 hypothetical protein [Klebsiella phage ZCKP1]